MAAWSSTKAAAMALFYASTIAGSRDNRVSQMELDKADALHPRASPESTTTKSIRPTMSTPYAVPLVTTFIPPESCNEAHLTMLSPPGYFIWLNEPVPVPGTTFSDCYPPEFLEYYTTYHVNPTTVGSHVPLMSPLVCPFGWQVVSRKGDYQACCPSGYQFTPPQTELDPDRPAYGGTCYSEWPLSSSTYITVYGSASESGEMLITASTSGFANYAHVIDGIVVSTSPPNSEPFQNQGTEHTTLAPGAIAGIVIGAVAAVGLVAAAFFIYAQRRRRASRQASLIQPPVGGGGATLSDAGNPIVADKPPSPVTEGEQTHTNFSEMDAGIYHVHELDAGSMPVEKP
ncbi:hypothetical protein F5B22DRAFT_469216 [Xylaria bambusicola]|uniref:uncharacterized protein n=1 Tax=Xylaria bambusicola TaxID=326684 RepID=UPI002007EA24|nr:uncharacterized protein F5B22DRAFT_469216 [Xylaria bambusicola]KAI0522292.1 hypothetical protein F5B22DRAFT_469216 [Xylaria bambusicola]